MKGLNVQDNLISQLPGNIYCKDLDGVIFWHNSNALEYFKRKIGINNLIGKTIYDFLDPKSADICYQDDIKILQDPSNKINIKQEKLFLINMEVDNYVTITKPIINCNNNNINGIMVNSINYQDIQQILQFSNLYKINNLSQNVINKENKIKYILKEILVIINIMQTIEVNKDFNYLLIELKGFVKKLLDYK